MNTTLRTIFTDSTHIQLELAFTKNLKKGLLQNIHVDNEDVDGIFESYNADQHTFKILEERVAYLENELSVYLMEERKKHIIAVMRELEFL